MSAFPVVKTDRWAGSFDCTACRRKRLTADEFSRKAMERHRKHGGSLTCRQCMQESEAKERADAAARRREGQELTAAPTMDDDPRDHHRECAGCGFLLGSDSYNRNQWNNKGPGKSKCRDCIDRAVVEETSSLNQLKARALEHEQQAVRKAYETGNSLTILQAESAYSALEAEKVTGLKPQILGNSRSLGRGGSGRGNGGRGRTRVVRGRGGCIR